MNYEAALRLDGQGFVVIGAGQGIGLAAATALHQLGAKVLCVDRSLELAESAAKLTFGHATAADVTKEAEVERLFRHADELFGASFAGAVDIVGRAHVRRIVDFTEQEWDDQFSLILKHAFFTIKHAAPRMKSGGSIVLVSSIAATGILHDQPAYGAAKAALNHLVASAATELGPSGVRVNAVAPGLTETPRVSAVLGEDGMQRIADELPLRRFNTTADVASAILFLSSGLARNITGTILPIDGGISNVSAFPKLHVGDQFLKAATAPQGH